MSITNGFAGVSNCYVFKSRLQEYAQKGGLLTPTYETIKEGPSHEPYFRSSVIVNNVRYDSLPGFSNQKAAEQSAAEVALMEIAKSGNENSSITNPVHETGLCKNLLQEYAQKMNYAVPSYYVSQKVDTPGGAFSCTVEVGGVQYIGATAKTKKEAEIKAARTALLAIHLNPDGNSEARNGGNYQLTVLPCRKKPEQDSTTKETPKPLKAKKPRLKKKHSKKKSSSNKGNQAQNDSTKMVCADNAPGMQIENTQRLPNQNEEQMHIMEANNTPSNGQTTALDFSQSEQGITSIGILSGVPIKDLISLAAAVNSISGIQQTAQIGAEARVVAGTVLQYSPIQNEDGRMAVDGVNVQKSGAEGINYDEDGRMAGEGENVLQRVGVDVHVSQGVYQQIDGAEAPVLLYTNSSEGTNQVEYGKMAGAGENVQRGVQVQVLQGVYQQIDGAEAPVVAGTGFQSANTSIGPNQSEDGKMAAVGENVQRAEVQVSQGMYQLTEL